MPQPALHLLLARQTLDRWSAGTRPPIEIADDRIVNAFMHGSLAPDMGNFPGGSRALARAVHTRRTGRLVQDLLAGAITPEHRAFAIGWLAHVIADVLVHPLVNEDAARRSADGTVTLVEHVRVEVGLDVWFCWQHAALEGIRLRPAFDRAGYEPLATSLARHLAVPTTPAQLTQMERGLILFSHGALHFATAVGRNLCWDGRKSDVPLGSSLLWHTASLLSPRNSVVNAYLNPHMPNDALVGRVTDALRNFHDMLDSALTDDARSLPDYDLETGRIIGSSGLRVA